MKMAKAKGSEKERRQAAREADVAATLTKLGGRSRADVTPDDRRGASSQLGHGEREDRRKRR